MMKNGNSDAQILEKICRQYGLGTLTETPRALTGGLMHKMYSLFTTKGKYAVKLLNPYVMQRADAMENFQTAERLELILENNKLPILPAISFGERKMQQTDGRYFYLYRWYDGKVIRGTDVREKHCAKIGSILAKIHALDFRENTYLPEEIHIDFNGFLQQFSKKNKELYRLLRENINLLVESQEKGNAALKKMPKREAICHNDMDCKNVLWLGDECRIIDLECLSYSSPYMELYELALCWSGYEECNIDYELFRSFISSYAKAGGQLPDDWEVLYDCNFGRLEWLEYNMKRALGIDCSDEEVAIGISEVKETIAHARYYAEAKNQILNCLEQGSVKRI